ncbi:MAG: tetratricopeptide repeat protein [Aureispira sp.]
MRILLLLSFLCFSSFLLAQDKLQQARELGRQAIKKMDAGEIAASLELLEQAQELDPDNIDYPYEMAYAYYLDKDYLPALKILKKLVKREDANALVHQMLGNTYDMNQQTQKAIAAYEEGLKLFPEVGILYLERGNMELKEERYVEALDFYEKGIDVDPTFPSNYYWATRIYLSSSEKIWGLLYGEIFMNLERNTSRTSDISKQLYDAYTSSIQINKKNKKKYNIDINICKTMIISVKELEQKEGPKLPFCMIYGTNLTLSVAPNLERIDINSLSAIRGRHIDNYYEQEHHKQYDNLLFQYQKLLQEKGHFNAYSHWILMKGDEPAFGAWLQKHEEEWEAFLTWFSENPLEITKDNAFHSSQF